MPAVKHELTRLGNVSPREIVAHFYDNFGVIAQQHDDGRLWLFDYDQLAAHKHRTTDVVMESRGLVLCAKTLDVIRRPFARFFNIGEAPTYEADIDYARLEALEKADGSLVTLYFNQVTGHWHFGTRGTPFADAHHREGGRFYERVQKAAGIAEVPGTDAFDHLLASMNKDVTYLFEFVGPDNHHVTRYEKSELVLLGARRNHNGVEYTPGEVVALLNVLSLMNWQVRLPKRYPIPLELKGMPRSLQIEAIKNWVATAPEFKGLHEGVVCYDPVTGKRLKVKTPLYVAVHLQGTDATGALTLSPSRMAELLVSGDADEFCLYFPKLADRVQAMAAKVTAFIDGLGPVWEHVKHIQDQKTFALAVQKQVPVSGSGLFFQARKDGGSPAEAWRTMALNKKAALVEKLIK